MHKIDNDGIHLERGKSKSRKEKAGDRSQETEGGKSGSGKWEVGSRGKNRGQKTGVRSQKAERAGVGNRK